MLCPYRSVRCLEMEGHGVRHICRLRFHAAGCTLPFEKDVLRETLLAADTVRFGSGGKLQRRQGGRCLHTLGWLDAGSPSHGVER